MIAYLSYRNNTEIRRSAVCFYTQHHEIFPSVGLVEFFSFNSIQFNSINYECNILQKNGVFTQ
jgi:hypothetical protein